jgi:hypothetical protein
MASRYPGHPRPGPRTHAHYAVSTPIVHTSNYYFDTADEVEEFMRAKDRAR